MNFQNIYQKVCYYYFKENWTLQLIVARFEKELLEYEPESTHHMKMKNPTAKIRATQIISYEELAHEQVKAFEKKVLL